MGFELRVAGSPSRADSLSMGWPLTTMPDPMSLCTNTGTASEQFLAAPHSARLDPGAHVAAHQHRVPRGFLQRWDRGPVAQIVIGKMLDHAGVALHLQPRQAERRYGPDLAAPS